MSDGDGDGNGDDGLSLRERLRTVEVADWELAAHASDDADESDGPPFPSSEWDEESGTFCTPLARCDECGFFGPKWAVDRHDHTECPNGYTVCDGPDSLRTCPECRRDTAREVSDELDDK